MMEANKDETQAQYEDVYEELQGANKWYGSQLKEANQRITRLEEEKQERMKQLEERIESNGTELRAARERIKQLEEQILARARVARRRSVAVAEQVASRRPQAETVPPPPQVVPGRGVPLRRVSTVRQRALAHCPKGQGQVEPPLGRGQWRVYPPSFRGCRRAPGEPRLPWVSKAPPEHCAMPAQFHRVQT